MSPRRTLVASVALALALPLGAAAPKPARTDLVLWAWERPEDLRFAPRGAEVAALSGFIELSGEQMVARGRRFPLRATPGGVTTSVVHVQIDPRTPVAWTPRQRAATAAAILGLAGEATSVQVDFEVRRSERQVLLDVLGDVRRGLPAETRLSMTALASWCETERWLDAAPVDEIVPMLFRMGPGGRRIEAKLTAGGDFANPRCRTALAISADTPLAGAPVGRRIYLFSPRSWTADDFRRLERSISQWS